jgi:hypothetical protein
MFPSLPTEFQHLADLDHVECPRSGALGDAIGARTKLASKGLDLAWNVVEKCFSIIQWETVHGWPCRVPCVVMHAVRLDDGRPQPLSEEYVQAVIWMNEHRGTVEQRARGRRLAEKHRRDDETEVGEIAMDESIKQVQDTNPGMRTDRIFIPAKDE